MEENQSDLALPDITEAEQLASNEEVKHENGDQVKEKKNFFFLIKTNK